MIVEKISDNLITGTPINQMILKFRQGGVSTFWLLMHLDRTIFNGNITAGILADLKENLGYLFEIIRFAHETMPDELKPVLGSDSKSELTFPQIGSKIMVSLAYKATTLHSLHVSEHAYIDPDNLRRSIGACTPDAWITKESTANGFNHFRDEWIETETNKLFLPWPLQDEYRIKDDDLKPLERTKDEIALADRMLKEYNIVIDDAQIRYRRTKKKELKNLFDQEMAESEEDCFLATGGAFFNGKKISILLKESKVQRLKSDDEWAVWETPQHRHVYVAGADVAEGGSGDYSVLVILCITCRKTALRYRAHCGVDFFYKLCNRIGLEYHKALLAPELNNHGHAVVMGLRELGYPNLYRQERKNRPSVKKPIKELLKFGWETTGDSKPVMMDQLKLALEGNSEEDEDNFEPAIHWLDTEFLKETLDIREEGGKIEAVTGKHDDMVMAYAIAWQMYRRELSRSAAFVLSGAKTGGMLESA